MEHGQSASGLYQAGRPYRKAAVCVLAGFALLHLLIVVLNHYCFRTFAFDYGVYNFAFFDFAHGRVSPCTLYGITFPVSFLQDHFSLLLFFFAPLYWLLTWLLGSYTLLGIQWLLIVAGGWATYRLIAEKYNDHKTALFALIYYFVLFGRYSSYAADCNLAIMGSALVPVFLYFFETKRMVAACVCFAVLILTREDYPIWFLFICLFLMLLHRKERPQLKLISVLLSVSIVFLLLTVNVFIPGLEDAHKKYDLFEFHAIGNTPAEAISFLFSHPLRAVELLFVSHWPDHGHDTVKLEFYAVYMLSGALLLLYRPLFLLPFLPLLAKKMYADAPFRWSVESYYSVEFVSLLPVLLFMIVGGIRDHRLRSGLGIGLCLLAGAVTGVKFRNEQLHHKPDYVNKYNFLDPSFYYSAYDISEVNAALKSIPDTAGLSCSGKIAPHMAMRKRIYYFDLVHDADYIMVLTHGDCYPLTLQNFQRQIVNLKNDWEWKVVQERADFILFRRVKP